MDYLLILLLLIISCIIGICISLLLELKSYLLSALICTIIYIAFEVYYYKFNNNNINNNNINNNNINSKSIKAHGINDLQSKEYLLSNHQNSFINTKNTVNSIDNTDKPPLDSLEPSELLSRLNYIYQATTNPTQVISYNTYKTHADNYLDKDRTSLLSIDKVLQKNTNGFYPYLTSNHINAHDCLNEGSEKTSCLQSPRLFQHTTLNLQNDTILNKGVNLDNASLIVKEDFSMPMLLDTHKNNMPIIFKNAPNGNLDKSLGEQGNEYINLSKNISNSQCTNCKLAPCQNNNCKLQNHLFM